MAKYQMHQDFLIPNFFVLPIHVTKLEIRFKTIVKSYNVKLQILLRIKFSELKVVKKIH